MHLYDSSNVAHSWMRPVCMSLVIRQLDYVHVPLQ